LAFYYYLRPNKALVMQLQLFLFSALHIPSTSSNSITFDLPIGNTILYIVYKHARE
jgi:hypothetical protein